MKLPRTPPAHRAILEGLSKARLQSLMGTSHSPTPAGQYHHWDILQHLKPPDELSHEEWWLVTKLARLALLKPLPLKDTKGRPFFTGTPDEVLECVHRIDRDASGQIQISELVTDPSTRDRYLVGSLIEEAITSSQLEGAATTHKVAKDMLRSGRKPRDRDERMIVNNFAAMSFLRRASKDKLTPDVVLELHRIVTESTLEQNDAAGRLRTGKDDPVYVWDQRDATLLHEPPSPDELPQRLREMCDFANGKTPGYFIHPVLRAIILHFWLGYDHPFIDGNGRTARALFYWSMLSQGYWLCEYLSISRILRRGPAKYMRAYLYSETDNNDVTYFAIFHLSVIERAISDLHAYLKKKMTELRETRALLKTSADLNHRQVAVLSHALRHPDAQYTIQTHRSTHHIVYETARTDLMSLEDKGLLKRQRSGRRFYFIPVVDLSDRLIAERKSKSASGAKSPRRSESQG